MKKSLQAVLSAIAGFLFAALLVLFCPINASTGYRDCWNALLDNQPGYESSIEPRFHNLALQMFWLEMAQKELKFLPLLVVCSCIGPVILMRRQRQRKSNET
jgi:hypothetical protein